VAFGVPRQGMRIELLLSNILKDTLNPGHQFRDVLIIEDEPSIRNVLHVMLAELGCEGDTAHSGRQTLPVIEKDSFDTMLLDLRHPEMSVGELLPAIKDLRSNLVGRVLVITGEVSDPQTMQRIKMNCRPPISRQRVKQERWERLRTLLGISKSSPHSTSRHSPQTHPFIGSFPD